MLSCHLLPVESMTEFITRRRSVEQQPAFAVISRVEQRSGLELALQALRRLDRLTVEGVELPQNLRSRVWATACSFAAISSNEKLGRAPHLAGVLLSEGVLPTELDGLPKGILSELAALAQIEAESLRRSSNSN